MISTRQHHTSTEARESRPPGNQFVGTKPTRLVALWLRYRQMLAGLEAGRPAVIERRDYLRSRVGELGEAAERFGVGLRDRRDREAG